MMFPRPNKAHTGFVGIASVVIALAGCGDNDVDQPPSGTGGTSTNSGAGGMRGTGGNAGAGGTRAAGGTSGTVTTPATGGNAGTGGAPATGGGTPPTGGNSQAGGVVGTGGSSAIGGSSGAGGSAATGGGSGTGEPGVQLQGRFDTTDATKPSFSWSGSAMVARFQGTGAKLRIDGSPNQFAVVIDGALAPQVLKVTSGTTQYTLATGLAAGAHDVVVWKRTEGNQGPNRFLGIDVVDGQLLAPPAVPDRRIEIYGDSITAGYGIDGAGPSCPWSPDTEDHYVTYGALTARALRAELHTIAWSGIGMYRNYGTSSASSDAMPAVYARIVADKSDSAWDFSKWQPHAVVVNLGTNDASSGDPGTPYETAYLGFVRTLRQKYPNTFFVLTIGPMLDGSNLTAIRGHIKNVISTRSSEGDAKMSYLEFPVQQQSDGMGCDWHPSPATNVKMSTLLTAELKTRLGW